MSTTSAAPETDYISDQPSMAERSSALLQKVQEIAPVLAEHAAEAERERHLSRPSFEAMRDAGLYRMWIPQDLGGYEVDPVTGMKVLEAVSAIDSAAGWNLQIGCAITILMAYLPEAGSNEVVESPYCAGGFFPLGRAVVVDGGYRLTARCSFSSGCHQASWFICQAQVFDGDTPRVDENGEPVVIWPFYRAEEGSIVDTWRTMGMRGTGSHDTVAEDVFVPEQRAARPAAADRSIRSISRNRSRDSETSGWRSSPTAAPLRPLSS